MLVQEHPFVAAMHVLYRSGYLHCNASVLHSVEPSGLALIAHRSLTSKRFSLRSWPDLLYRQSSRRPVIAKAASAELTAEVQVSAPEAAGFTDFQLDDRVTAFLGKLGVQQPTPVQSGAIPLILGGQNVAVQSHTGSGKTLAYLLPALSLAVQRAELEYNTLQARGRPQDAGALQAVIVAPSRELAMQIFRVGQSLLPHEARGCIQQCIGGANPYRQEDAIKVNRPLMVVGTPGRLGELSRAGVLQTHGCGLLILDEVDQLLAPQFAADVSRLAAHCGKRLPQGRQTIIASATINPQVLIKTDTWCPTPAQLSLNQARMLPAADRTPLRQPSPGWGWDPLVRSRGDKLASSSTPSSVGGMEQGDMVPTMPPQLSHWWVPTSHRHRTDTARRAIHALDAQRVLVFMNFQSRLKDTEAKLKAGNMSVSSLSGDLKKQERQTILAKFQRGDFRALIVSDVMARGLDIPECDAVFHLELPSDAAHYAHRAGRTGRLGRPGTIISFVEPHDEFVIRKLERKLGVPIAEAEISHGQLAAPHRATVAQAPRPSPHEQQEHGRAT